MFFTHGNHHFVASVKIAKEIRFTWGSMTRIRKHESGCSKRKKKQKQDKLLQSITGSIDRFVKVNVPVVEDERWTMGKNISARDSVIMDNDPVLIDSRNGDKKLNIANADEKMITNASDTKEVHLNESRVGDKNDDGMIFGEIMSFNEPFEYER